MTNLLIDPRQVVKRAYSVAGYSEFVKEKRISKLWELHQATITVQDWSEDWPEDEGFGSSDHTYLLKDFIDSLISGFAYGKYETNFNPVLVVSPK